MKCLSGKFSLIVIVMGFGFFNSFRINLWYLSSNYNNRRGNGGGDDGSF